MRLLITGATGFIGGAVVARACLDPTLDVWGSERRALAQEKTLVDPMFYRDLAPDTDWAEAVSGVEAVVHTAARVHVMNDPSRDPLLDYRRTNVEGTLSLARQAVEAGVRRFIFISSIMATAEYSKWPSSGSNRSSWKFLRLSWETRLR